MGKLMASLLFVALMAHPSWGAQLIFRGGLPYIRMTKFRPVVQTDVPAFSIVGATFKGSKLSVFVDRGKMKEDFSDTILSLRDSLQLAGFPVISDIKETGGDCTTISVSYLVVADSAKSFRKTSSTDDTLIVSVGGIEVKFPCETFTNFIPQD